MDAYNHQETVQEAESQPDFQLDTSSASSTPIVAESLSLDAISGRDKQVDLILNAAELKEMLKHPDKNEQLESSFEKSPGKASQSEEQDGKAKQIDGSPQSIERQHKHQTPSQPTEINDVLA